MDFVVVNTNFADALSGERIFPGERVLDTGYPNIVHPYSLDGKTLFLKESTIVGLARAAGFVVERVERDSGDSEVVDGADVSVGGGEASVGEVPAGGKSASKRRSDGSVKGK